MIMVSGKMSKEDHEFLRNYCKGDPRKTHINFITDAIAEKIAKEKRKAK